MPFDINMTLSNELLSEPELPLSDKYYRAVSKNLKIRKKFALRKKI